MSTEYLNNKTFEHLIVKFQQAKRQHARYKMFMEDITSTEQRVNKRGKFKKPISWTDTEVVFHKVCYEFKEVRDDLAIAFYTLSQNIVRYAKFNLIDQDDAIQEGVLICFEKIDRFDPSKGKAFNYLTTCILNHYRQLYRTARNYNELKKKYLNFLQNKYEQQLPVSKGIFKKHNIVND